MSETYEARSPREAELVLSPNEFAYVLDKTKGHVTTWVGPTKTSLSNTDSPVVFDAKTFSFVEVPLTRAIQKLIVVPESWYGQLKNPAENHPKPGNANSGVDLKTGQKINVKGPASFALYPGQMMRVISGHSLRSNQYLIIRIYDDTKIHREDLNIPAITEDTDLAVGKQFIIKGTEMAFFIPPDGIEVVRDGDTYVREALTLEQLEYCILLNEDGNKRYVKGPDVVFPTVTEKFVPNKQGRSVFRALELTPTSGVYIKVTADYEEDGVAHKTGEELFITGNQQMIYFPRKEHTIIRYSNQPINFATAVPAGDARYVLNKNTGSVGTVKGPAMILPDPRFEVFINRMLNAKECQMLFPNNSEVLSHNRNLLSNLKSDDGNWMGAAEAITKLSSQLDKTFDRGTVPHKPHSITINNQFEGAVKFTVWTGYAVQIVKGNQRRVVIGPAQVILDYDETIEILSLSSGKPKNTDRLIETAFLRYNNNKVSDIIRAQTADFVNVDIKVSFLVNFDPDQSGKWFSVDNYVKLLCDRVRSKIKRTVKALNIRDFYANGYDIVRRRILGEEGSSGMVFDENGMKIVDVDILSISIDNDVETQLEAAANKAFKDSLLLDDLKAQAEAKEESLTYQKTITSLETELERAKLEAQLAAVKSKNELMTAEHKLEMSQFELTSKIEAAELEAAMDRDKARNEASIELEKARIEAALDGEMAKKISEIDRKELELSLKEKSQKIDIANELEKIETEKLADEGRILYMSQTSAVNRETLASQAEAQKMVLASIDPHLTAELRRLADSNENFRIADTLAKNLAPTSLIAGKSMADILVDLSQGTVYQDIFKGFVEGVNSED